MKNAYKHFNFDPADYSLIIIIKGKNKYLFECIVPFGMRNSSLMMQIASNAKIDTLAFKDMKG